MPRQNLLPFLKYLARFRAILLQIDLLEQTAVHLRGDLQEQMYTYIQRQRVVKRWLKREIVSLGRTLGVRARDLPI